MGQVRNLEKELSRAVIERLGELPEDVQRLVNAATYDLYYGPYSEGEVLDDGWEYPGFTKALDTITDALDDIIEGDLYYEDWSGCLMTSEPEGDWIDAEGEPCASEDDGATWCEPEPYYLIDRKRILEAYLGSELASYI